MKKSASEKKVEPPVKTREVFKAESVGPVRLKTESCQIISFPISQSPKRDAEEEKEKEKGANQSTSDCSDEDMISQCQSGLLSPIDLYRNLRERWGEGVFEGTRSCHENMKSRCKKGYSVIDPAFESFTGFLLHMGPRPHPQFSIDRIDNSRGYSPNNCRWADKLTQTRNRSNTVSLTVAGETFALMEWARKAGVPASELYKRRAEGLNDYQVVHGKTPAILPSSKYWPPKGWDELDACVRACTRWSNQNRRELRNEISSCMRWIDDEAEFFGIPKLERGSASTESIKREEKWNTVYLRYKKLLETVEQIPSNRYE